MGLFICFFILFVKIIQEIISDKLNDINTDNTCLFKVEFLKMSNNIIVKSILANDSKTLAK